MRLDLAKRLGRMPSGDENALRLYRVFREVEPVGMILTRRVKGRYGGIELVLAVDTNQVVRGLRLQRLREPVPITVALADPKWRGSLAGKRAGDPWQLGADIPEVPNDARASAQAILDGARSSLILLAAAEQAPPASLAQAHHQ
jgi:hypothetical protein